MEWIDISKEQPRPYCNILVCRNVNGNYYVDFVNCVEDDPAGLAPFPTMKHVTHWMPVPAPPPQPYDIDGDS